MKFENRILQLSIIIAVILVIISLRIWYWQVWKGKTLQPVAADPISSAFFYTQLRGEQFRDEDDDDLFNNLDALPRPVIQRTMAMLSTIKRGKIYDRNGNVLAEDKGNTGSYIRYYSAPTLAHVVGYSSALRIGASGLEATYNSSLLGFDRLDTELDRVLHRPSIGSDLVLTIDPDIQRVASEVLDNRPGAAIVLDGKTGAVLAMTSYPSYDPNRLFEDGYIASLGQGAFLNRATQGLYVPGSTWKTVTMIAALDTGKVEPDTIFDFGEPRSAGDGKLYYVYEVDGGIIPDYTHQQRYLDLTMAYNYSANVAFAKLADELNPDILIDYASRLGFSNSDFHKNFPLEIPLFASQLANDVNSIRTNNLLRASTGFGQGELLVTPLNMAMVVESVINNGSISIPHFVHSIRDPQGRIIRTNPNHASVHGVMKPTTARQVKDIMISWVTDFGGGEKFTGSKDIIMGLKTGTAQLGGDLQPHAWIIGFVESGEKNAVIVLFLENGGTSAQLLPVFQKVAQSIVKYYFGHPELLD